jgi:hypothetical protein
MRMAEVTRSTSEWHRRMTSENLSQTGQLVNLANMPIGAEAYIDKPPSQQEAIRKGRRVKHIDHYIGPGRIVRHIGTRSIVVVIKDDHDVDREYQRDAEMVLLKKPRPDDAEPEIMREQSIGTRLCSKDDLSLHALKEGEIIILKDELEAKDWYCAEVRAVLADRIEVNYFTTQAPALDDYDKYSIQKRKARSIEALFLRTWCLSGGKGKPTTNPPSTKHARTNHLYMVGKNSHGRRNKSYFSARRRTRCHWEAGQEHD